MGIAAVRPLPALDTGRYDKLRDRTCIPNPLRAPRSADRDHVGSDRTGVLHLEGSHQEVCVRFLSVCVTVPVCLPLIRVCDGAGLPVCVKLLGAVPSLSAPLDPAADQDRGADRASTTLPKCLEAELLVARGPGALRAAQQQLQRVLGDVRDGDQEHQEEDQAALRSDVGEREYLACTSA